MKNGLCVASVFFASPIYFGDDFQPMTRIMAPWWQFQLRVQLRGGRPVNVANSHSQAKPTKSCTPKMLTSIPLPLLSWPELFQPLALQRGIASLGRLHQHP